MRAWSAVRVGNGAAADVSAGRNDRQRRDWGFRPPATGRWEQAARLGASISGHTQFRSDGDQRIYSSLVAMKRLVIEPEGDVDA